MIKKWMQDWLVTYWAMGDECQLPNEFIEERFGQDAIALFGNSETDKLFKRAARRAGMRYSEMQGYHDEWENLFLNALAIMK